MSNLPLISIVIATCNGARYFSEQLESVLSQTYKNLEVIISDDCSEDETLKIARKFTALDGRIRLFSNEKRLGIAINFLKALEHCRGDYICFCDQDDYWRDNKVACLLKLMKQDEETMLVYSDLEVCDDDLNQTHSSFWKMSAIQPVQGELDARILLRNLAPGCSMMFRRAVMENLLNYSTNSPLLHDHLAFVTSCRMGKVLFTKEKLVKYRQHSMNVIGAGRKSSFAVNNFVIEIRKLIIFFKGNSVLQDRFDFKKISSFCDARAEKKLWQLPYLGYYLFLHPATWKGRLLALFECLLPQQYQAVKKKFRCSMERSLNVQLPGTKNRF